ACYCSDHEEELTSVKHGGELTIRVDSPMFDYVYQKEFAARLSLADASAYVDAGTPFGGISARMFASADSHTTVLHCRVTSDEGEAPEIRLARWGSRVLWRWYAKQLPEPEIGLDGTETCADGDRIYITQELNATKFCVGLAMLCDTAPRLAERKNCHESFWLMPRKNEYDITLYWTVQTGETTEDAKVSCDRTLDDAIRTGEDALFASHSRAWAEFWNKSYLRIADDYIENLYYLYLYYMNSESRGAYPPHFTQGVWGWYHDYLPWVFYFHYNMQHLYAPLDAAGHGDLGDNYYDMRRNGLDVARLYAQIAKGGKHGAFYHDVCDRYSRGADWHMNNVSCASQIGMQMYRHYRFNGDETFLQSHALPVMHAAAEYYLDILEMGEDGLYHTHDTTCYEGNLLLNDTITDNAMIRALFSALIPHTEDEALRGKYEDVLSHLPLFETVPLTIGNDWDGTHFLFGVGKGKTPVGRGEVFAMGYDNNGKRYRKTFGTTDPEPDNLGDDAFPDAELAPLYPSGVLGLKDRGTHFFETMQNQIFLHPYIYAHWGMLPIFCARMGMADEFLEASHRAIEAFQHFPCGFNVENDGEFPAVGKFLNVYNTLTDDRSKLRQDAFIHFDFETVPVIMQGLTDALLQSHEGCVRICPAIRAEDSVSYSLFAEGGFSVFAEVTADSCVVAVTSQRGNPLYLDLPPYLDRDALYAYRAEQDADFVPCDWKIVERGQDRLLDFSDLRAGETVLMTTVTLDELELTAGKISAPNGNMKQHGTAYLGLPRLLQ
ncbi:MAG: hypothetical protein IKV66_14830, partial [Clostridia bacterium]|nr:hypothetical protein [Clostridia bacterium]